MNWHSGGFGPSRLAFSARSPPNHAHGNQKFGGNVHSLDVDVRRETERDFREVVYSAKWGNTNVRFWHKRKKWIEEMIRVGSVLEVTFGKA